MLVSRQHLRLYSSPVILRASKSARSRSQRPRGVMRGSAAARMLRLRVRIPLGAWMFVFSECCLLAGRGLCVGLIAHLEKSYRTWCVGVIVKHR
jgi:hypothetical protein